MKKLLILISLSVILVLTGCEGRVEGETTETSTISSGGEEVVVKEYEFTLLEECKIVNKSKGNGVYYVTVYDKSSDVLLQLLTYEYKLFDMHHIGNNVSVRFDSETGEIQSLKLVMKYDQNDEYKLMDENNN